MGKGGLGNAATIIATSSHVLGGTFKVVIPMDVGACKYGEFTIFEKKNIENRSTLVCADKETKYLDSSVFENT